MGGVHKGAAAGLAPAYSFSAYVAEVEVDVETGIIKCTDVWAAHDCGKALNPLAVEGQIIGSCHMGLGQVLTEQMVYGRTGHLQNANLLDYKIPSVHEMPNVTQSLSNPVIQKVHSVLRKREKGHFFQSSSSCQRSLRCHWN